jgi:uncharacterized protein
MLPQPSRILYLHGFASSPSSRKAGFFAERLRAIGFQVDIPDLAEGNFTRLTISRQLRLTERITRAEPVILIGSSLGGYLAALLAARHRHVMRLILLAPAFQFYNLWMSELHPDDIASWQQTGTRSVFHYGAGRNEQIGYQLMDDASQFEGFPDFFQPALIFHGNHDSVVPVQYSAEFCQSHPNVQLVLLESGHELTDVLDTIWEYSKNFLLAGGL